MVLIDRLLLLVRLGFVVPVLRYICNRTHSLDHSLVTYFVGQLMAMMATPLVEEWTRWVLTILSAEGIVRAFVAKADGVAPLKQFCSTSAFSRWLLSACMTTTIYCVLDSVLLLPSFTFYRSSCAA